MQTETASEDAPRLKDTYQAIVRECEIKQMSLNRVHSCATHLFLGSMLSTTWLYEINHVAGVASLLVAGAAFLAKQEVKGEFSRNAEILGNFYPLVQRPSPL